jgi:membrane associated rhomboid family serine protease
MRPMRSRGGFELPQLNSMTAKLMAVFIGGSLLTMLSGTIAELVLLQPGEVLGRLAVWQLVTYAFVTTEPFSVLFGALIIYWSGMALESVWGSRRLLGFVLAVPALAGAITTLLALVIHPLRGAAFSGGVVMTGALWVAYGLMIGRGQTNFWGIPVTGNTLAMIGAGLVVLYAARYGVLVTLPEAIALLLTWAYMRGASPRLVLLKLQSWRFQRQLKARSRHLRVVTKDRNTPKDSDRFLH